MKRNTEIIIRKSLITFVSMIMFLCCLYPWNTFLAVNLSSAPLSFKTMLFLLLSAYSVFSVFSGSRFIILYFSTGLIISFFTVSYFYYRNISPYIFSFFPVQTLKGVLNYLLLIFYTALIWYAAFRIRKAENSRRTGRARFDTGISFFLLLFIVKLLISFKGGNILIYDKYTDWFFLYLFTGLVLLSLFSDEHSAGNKVVSDFFRKTVIIVLFMLIILTAVFAVLYNFAPELKEIAAAGSGIIGEAAGPVERWAVIIIRFLMDLKYRKKVVSALSSGNAPGISMGSPDSGMSEIIVIVFFLVVMLPVIVLLLYIFVRMIIRRILKTAGKGSSGKNMLPGFILAAFHLIKALSARIFSRKRIPPAVKYFRLLKLKGRITGLPPSPAETPLEYGKRLALEFSVLENEIMDITEIFCEYTYGKVYPSEEMILKSRSNVLRILNPLVTRKKSAYTKSS